MTIGLPCQHAIVAIAWKNERPEDYVHQLLTMDAINVAYGHSIQAVNSEEYWEEIGHPRPIPPKIKRHIGRPKKQRKKDNDEAPGMSRKLKRSFEVKCSKCGGVGHYY